MKAKQSRAVARRDSGRLRSADLRVARETICVPLGNIVSGEAVVKYGTHTWDAAYDTGGEPIADAAAVPGLVDVLMMPYSNGVVGAVYFEWDNAAGKMEAFDANHVEIVGSTDLSSLSARPWLAIGSAGSSSVIYKSQGVTTLLSARLQVSTAVTADSSDYWTLTLRHRRDGQSTGEDVASYTTSDRSLSAGEDVTLYDDERGLRLSDGELLTLDVSETGDAAALQGAVLWVTVQRVTR